MIEQVEGFSPKHQGALLAEQEAAVQGEVDNVIARPWDNVAPGVAEGERLGSAERIRVKPVVGGTLVARQGDAHTRHNVGPVRRPCVGEVAEEIDGIQRRAILFGDDAADLPIGKEVIQRPGARQVIREADAQAFANVEERQAALKLQVSFILRRDAVEQAGQYRIAIVYRFRPDEAGQKTQAARQPFLGFELQGIV